jgi:hypothetical protein
MRNLAALLRAGLLAGLVGCAASGPRIDSDNYSERKSAISRADQATLARVAITEKEPWLRRDAVERLSDQAVLGRVALHDADGTVRSAAVARLTDQEVLARVAQHDPQANVRSTAIVWLVPGPALNALARQSPELNLRRLAVRRVTDGETLRAIALNDPDATMRQHATERIADQTTLAEIALAGREIASYEAIRKLALQADLLRVAESKLGAGYRAAAMQRLTDQERLLRAALTDSAAGVREAAAQALTEPRALARVALESHDLAVRRAVVTRLDDQAVLARVLAREGDVPMLLAVIARLNDAAALGTLLERPATTDSRVACALASKPLPEARLQHVQVELSPRGGVAELRLLMIDPLVRQRLPDLRLQCHAIETQRTYTSAGLGGGSITKMGDDLKLTLTHGATTLRTETWAAQFPGSFTTSPGTTAVLDRGREGPRGYTFDFGDAILGALRASDAELEALALRSRSGYVRRAVAQRVQDPQVRARLQAHGQRLAPRLPTAPSGVAR